MTGPVLVDSDDGGGRGARAARDLPRRAARQARGAERPGAARGPLRRRARRLPGRAPLRGRQHVDARADRATCCRASSGSRRRCPRPLAHALDELGREPGAAGHGLQRRGRDLHRPLRRSGPTRRDDDANVAWADGPDARDGGPGLGHPAGRREPRPAARALRQRRRTWPGSTRSARATTRTACFHAWMGRP